MFGQPEEAKRALQAADLNYFLFTREDSIADPLPLSPLFTPDNIGRYLGVRWTDGTSVLLTWLGPGRAAAYACLARRVSRSRNKFGNSCKLSL